MNFSNHYFWLINFSLPPGFIYIHIHFLLPSHTLCKMLDLCWLVQASMTMDKDWVPGSHHSFQLRPKLPFTAHIDKLPQPRFREKKAFKSPSQVTFPCFTFIGKKMKGKNNTITSSEHLAVTGITFRSLVLSPTMFLKIKMREWFERVIKWSQE